MSTWLYYHEKWGNRAGWLGEPWDAPVETVGARQAEIMLTARASSGGTAVLLHDRASNAERMAARRLVERGLLTVHQVGGGQGTWREQHGRYKMRLYVYALTERGRTCWLRVPK